MYKSKLQELCSKKRWALPIYSCIRDGPDHNPHFKASVVVNGDHFDALTISKSLKDAHNEAAKLAFLHFTSGSVEMMADMDGGDQKDSKTHQLEILPDCMDMQKKGLEQNYQMMLQIYAQRKDLGLPLYRTIETGPPNALCYKTTVTIDGDNFESPGYYRTVRQAEKAAAQAALMSLSTKAFQENNVGMYKNLLQELSRKEGFFKPTYVTTRAGEAHDSIFLSTVEVEGEVFQGNPGKSKKQAEHNAARVAYESILARNSCHTYKSASSCSDDVVQKLASQVEKITVGDPVSSCISVSPADVVQKHALANAAVVEVNEDSSKDLSADVTKSYLLCDRIRVYTYIPRVDASSGNVVLPIAEGKWVVASLEFAE